MVAHDLDEGVLYWCCIGFIDIIHIYIGDRMCIKYIYIYNYI